MKGTEKEIRSIWCFSLQMFTAGPGGSWYCELGLTFPMSDCGVREWTSPAASQCGKCFQTAFCYYYDHSYWYIVWLVDYIHVVWKANQYSKTQIEKAAPIFFCSSFFKKQLSIWKKQIFHWLVHFPDDCNGQGWARPKSEGARTLSESPTWATIHLIILCCCSQAIVRIKTGVTRARTCAYMGCWHHRCQFY